MITELPCRQCGECCMAFEIGPLEEEEDVAFKTYFSKDGEEFVEKCRPDWSPEWAQMGVCVYLGKDLKCTIYDKRPAVCREFQCRGHGDGLERLRHAKRMCSDQGRWSPDAFRLFFWKTLRPKEREG